MRNTKTLLMIPCLAIALVLATMILTGCSAEQDKNGIRIYSPSVSEAMATATVSAAQVARANSELDLSIREKNAQAELDAKRAEIETNRMRAEAEALAIRTSAEAEAKAKLAEAEAQRTVIQAKGQADVETIKAKGQAEAQTELATGEAKSWTIVTLGIGLSGVAMLGALAFVIWVTGRSVATAYNDILKAQYVQIGVEPRTLLPPPLVITRDGYLIDTRSGERAKLRNAAGVDRLRLAATTQSTNIALLARAAQDIGKTNHGKQSGGTQAADILPGIGASVPLLDVAEGNNGQSPESA